MEIRLADDVSSVVRLGVVTLHDCTTSACGLDERMTRREEELREMWGGKTAGDIPELAAARKLYRAVGIDPTRRRPSSEALVRRVLRGDSLPRINPAVDACNLSAATYFLSIGLYDLDKLEPPITARLGREGEWYEGLGKPRVNLGGRFLLEDRNGPFGNPSSDSKRTSVDASTRNLLWVIFAPFDHDVAALRDHLDWSATLGLETRLCGGRSEALVFPAYRDR